MSEAKRSKVAQSKRPSKLIAKEELQQANVHELTGNLVTPTTEASIQTHAARLSHPHVPTIQRRMMAAQIGKVSGNQYLQRVLEQINWNAVPADTQKQCPAGKAPPNPDEAKPSVAFAKNDASAVRQATSAPRIQRDLVAYNKPKIEPLPSMSAMVSSYVEMSAEAPGIRRALSDLIASGKIKEVQSVSGNKSWFAAQHHKNAQLKEIREALQKAGYAKADKLARTIYDIHGEFLYTKKELTTVAPFYSSTTNLGEKIGAETHRSMTEWEIRQAKRVFGDAISYPEVTIAEGSISAKIGSAGGYARTVGNTIYFPPGGSRNMTLMIHELTHVWQYQTIGWTYAPKALWAQVAEGYSYKDKGKSAEQTLKDARAAGKTIDDYNKEQQGDILSDYYRRLQRGKDVSAWELFVNDIRK